MRGDDQKNGAAVKQDVRSMIEPLGTKPRVLRLADLRFSIHGSESANVHIRGMDMALGERCELLQPSCRLGLAILRLVSQRGRPSGALRLVEAAGLVVGVLEMMLFVLRNRADFAYVRHAMWLAPVLALLRILRVPIVLEVNGLVATERRLAGKDVMNPIASLELSIIRLAARVRCVSAYLAHELEVCGIDATRLFVAHNGVDERLFEVVRERLPAPATIGFVGSGSSWHDLPTLVDAFELAVSSIPEARLLIVGTGGGDLRSEVEARGLSSKVEIRGGVSHADAIAAYHEIEIAVNPGSAPHHSPLKLFEAMAFGTPIVAGRAAGICEVLENERTALLVDSGDSRQLAEALVRLLRDAELRERLGNAAREEARCTHTWQRVADLVIRAGCAAAGR